MFVLAGYAQHRGSGVARRVLLLDAEAASSSRVMNLLVQAGYSADLCASPDAAFAVLSKGEHGVLVIQQHQSLAQGSALAGQVQRAHADVSVIVLAVDEALDTTVSALQTGVFDFMTRSFEPSTLPGHLLDTLRRVVEAEREASAISAAAPRDSLHEVLVGDCLLLDSAREQVRAALADGAPVLITGEAGTEKLSVARWLHDVSERRAAPFVVVKGPAAHAQEPVQGSTDAPPGTHFLAEASAFDADSQLALAMRFTRSVSHPDRPEPRLLAGLNEPPAPGWEGSVLGSFFARADGWQVSLPPLRERGRDVVILAEHFAEQARLALGDASLRLTASANEALSRYPWPGNVDELRLAIQHAASLCTQSTIRVADLPPGIGSSLAQGPEESGTRLRVPSLEDMELAYILRVLEAVGGNKASAARLLGVDRTTLYRKLQRQEKSDVEATRRFTK